MIATDYAIRHARLNQATLNPIRRFWLPYTLIASAVLVLLTAWGYADSVGGVL